jgi:elongator complex protein 1
MDLNLLYDLNPEGFMQDLDVFVKQIHNVDLINLFLSSLKDNAGDGRINKICDAIREKIILLGDSNRFILSVICSYVRKSPSDIESALRHISKLSETDDDEAANANDLESQSSALKYLLCLVDDIEELFSCALGLYDLKLTALIGRNSQKDPREYLPFLQKADELGKSNVWLQKHFIDMHLKRFDKALINLSNAGEEHFEKCLNLIEEYKLYKQGLHIYLKDKDQRKWKIVMLSYGSFLLNEVKNYSHAAQVFTAAGDLERAFEAHMKCNEWKQALCIAGELGRDSQSVAYDVVEGLKAAPTSQNLASAARILLDYFADNEVDEAVALLCRSNNFFEALRICHVFQRDDLIATVYKPAIISAYTSMSQDLTKRHSRFNYCSNRLRTIRSEKKKNLGDDADFEKEDLVSEAGSTLSVFTLSSQSSITSTMARSWSTASLLLGKGDSSRSSELHEMRKARKTKMKEGHPKEEAFLLKELKSLAPKQTLCNESQVLIESLMHSKELGKAASYHKQLKEFLDEVASQESNAMPYGDWPSEIYENGSDLGKLKFDWIDFLETITSESVDASNSANENLENKTNESDDIGFGLGLF